MHSPVRTLVAGVASLDRDDTVLSSVAALAGRLGAHLHLVHSFFVAPDALLAGEGTARSGHDAVRLFGDGLKARMEALLRPMAPRAGFTCHATPLSPPQAIERVALEVGADLAVLGAARRSTLRETILGTTAQRLFRGARVPVLVLDRDLPDAARVLLATDLSHTSAHACARGLALARALPPGTVELRALFVTPYEPLLAASRAEVEAAARPELELFLADLQAEDVEPHVATGDAAKEIVAQAAAWGADLVVVGTHGRTGATRVLLGSVAEAVLRSALCSVLVIPPVRAGVLEASGAASGGAEVGSAGWPSRRRTP